MFGSLKNLISSLVEDARLQNLEDADCRLATAALLTRERPSTVKCRRLNGKNFMQF